MSNSQAKISVVKLRKNGGNAVVTIPVSIMKESEWSFSQVIMQYDKETNKITISPVTALIAQG